MMALAVLLCLQDLAYDTLMIEAGGRADKIVARDLNGDGKTDFVVQDGRDIQLFLNQGGKFPPRPQHTLRLDPTVFLWTFGNLDGQKLPALFTAGSRATQAHGFDGAAFSAPRDLVVHPSIFEGTSAEGQPPLFLEFTPDLDRDGRAELLLFRKDEMFVIKRLPGGEFRSIQKLPLPVDIVTVVPWAPYQKFTEMASVPVLAFGDTNGDGRPDITTYHEESVSLFRQEADGTFSTTKNLDLTTEKRKRRGRRFFQFDIPPRVADFNGDGLVDIALIYPSKGRVQIYYGRTGRTDFTQPDDLMRVADGWSTGITLEDLDGDGKLDLVMGIVRKFGITDGIQVFLSGKVDLELHIYPMQGNGRFTKDPVQELRFSIPFAFQLTRDSASLDLAFRPNFEGDFDKDGLRDMLVRVDEKTLRIYPGVRGQFIRDQPTGAITMNPPENVSATEPFVTELNGDGVPDLILKHVMVNPPRHVLELKLSRQ
jgi:hypothetical protein